MIHCSITYGNYFHFAANYEPFNYTTGLVNENENGDSFTRIFHSLTIRQYLLVTEYI